MIPWSLKTPETFLAHCLKQMAHFMLVVQKLSQIIFMSIQPTLDCFFCAWPANIKIFLLKKKKKQWCCWGVQLHLLICHFVDTKCFPANFYQLIINSRQNKQKFHLLN